MKKFCLDNLIFICVVKILIIGNLKDYILYDIFVKDIIDLIIFVGFYFNFWLSNYWMSLFVVYFKIDLFFYLYFNVCYLEFIVYWIFES